MIELIANSIDIKMPVLILYYNISTIQKKVEFTLPIN